MNIKKYNEIADKNKPQKQVLKHTASAFLVGGVIGMIGEFFLNLYKELFSFSEKEATPIIVDYSYFNCSNTNGFRKSMTV